MGNVKRIQFSADIAAPVATVYARMIDPAHYRVWTSAFCEGSTFEGSWATGSRILFHAGTGDGMVSEIAENRPDAFISIRHLGFLQGGVEDTQSDAVRAWAGALENYTFTKTPAGTHLLIDLDVTDQFEDDMREAWPKALARLKTICEK
ncbi:MAG TPA: SRPBCC domain-containing protein [Usitatibacteraceae bacterium]|nr:SRPBCC domain-containing protein [Usitatibacteraceae bacterium]